jgi:hypothetical protein
MAAGSSRNGTRNPRPQVDGMTRHDPRAAAMPEDRGPDSLDAHVRRLIADLGLWGYHARTSKGSEPGFPDWLIIGPHKVLYRELKSETGQLTSEQRRVGQMLRQAGQSWAVWRPSDLLSGLIARELADVAAVQLELFQVERATP